MENIKMKPLVKYRKDNKSFLLLISNDGKLLFQQMPMSQSPTTIQGDRTDAKIFGTLNLPTNDYFIDALITYEVAFNYGIYGGRNGLLLILEAEKILEKSGYRPQNELYLESAPLNVQALLNAFEDYDFDLSKGESLLDSMFKTFDFFEREKALSSAILDSDITITNKSLQDISRHLASPYYESAGMFEETVARKLWQNTKQHGSSDVARLNLINAIRECFLSHADNWLFGHEKSVSAKILNLLSNKSQDIILQDICILACGGKKRKDLLDAK